MILLAVAMLVGKATGTGAEFSLLAIAWTGSRTPVPWASTRS